jgi:hypothetical protein
MPAASTEKGGRKKGEKRREYNTRFGQSEKNPEPVEIPEGAEHIWNWFWALSKRRRSGPEHIAYQEIGEWSRLTGTLVSPDEIDMLLAMDDAWMLAIREDQDKAEVEAKGYTTTDGPKSPPTKAGKARGRK